MHRIASGVSPFGYNPTVPDGKLKCWVKSPPAARHLTAIESDSSARNKVEQNLCDESTLCSVSMDGVYLYEGAR
jgi:hypothetical protein